jgi:hypothetical protein
VRTAGTGDLGGGIGGAIVGEPDGRAGKCAGERGERGGDALGLVARRYDDDDAGGSVGDAIYCGAPVVATGVWRTR